ncbi:hypothetical protein AMTRI_Chr03g146470 [Amborella trichopoda]
MCHIWLMQKMGHSGHHSRRPIKDISQKIEQDVSIPILTPLRTCLQDVKARWLGPLRAFEGHISCSGHVFKCDSPMAGEGLVSKTNFAMSILGAFIWGPLMDVARKTFKQGPTLIDCSIALAENMVFTIPRFLFWHFYTWFYIISALLSILPFGFSQCPIWAQSVV